MAPQTENNLFTSRQCATPLGVTSPSPHLVGLFSTQLRPGLTLMPLRLRRPSSHTVQPVSKVQNRGM